MSHFYVFVRTDLSVADQICQVAHACVEAGKRFAHPEHTNLVLLAVNDEAELLAISEKCVRNKVDFYVNHEPDDGIGFSSLATGVIAGSTRRIFSSVPLWKSPGEKLPACA